MNGSGQKREKKCKERNECDSLELACIFTHAAIYDRYRELLLECIPEEGSSSRRGRGVNPE